MAATTGGALKAHIEALGLGVAVFRDSAPPGALYPFVVVHEGIALTAESAFNSFDDSLHHVAELAQVDVWQLERDPASNVRIESYTLPDAVALGLSGAVLTALPTFGGHTRMQSRVRLREPEEANTLIHDAITVEVHRTLARKP